jgi:hypothetical protein
MGGENLRDGAAAVVRHKVHLVDAERIEKLGHHPRLGRERNVVRRPDFGVAEPHQVKRDATPASPQLRDDVAPVKSIQGHPVDEKRDGPAALLDVGDAA